MRSVLNRPGAAAGVVGALVALQLLAARLLGSATVESVTFAGRELGWVCAFRQAFGVPCPACGLTRSVLLTLHGQLRDALVVNPAGPLFVAGAMLFSAAMMLIAAYQLAGRARVAPDSFRRAVVLSASAYAGLTAVVLVAHWVRVIN